jgi:multidrug efflux system outer membrane protein
MNSHHQTDSVKLTKLRFETSPYEAMSAQRVLDTANADIPNLEREIGQEEDAIIFYLGLPNGVPRGLSLVDQSFRRKYLLV